MSAEDHSHQLTIQMAITVRHMPPGGHYDEVVPVARNTAVHEQVILCSKRAKINSSCKSCLTLICIFFHSLQTGLCTVYFTLQYMTKNFHPESEATVPVAPRGCPLEMRPPLGLTTNLPPYVLSPRSISSPALPADIIRIEEHKRKKKEITKQYKGKFTQ